MAFSLFSLFSCKGTVNLDADAFEKKLSEDGSVQLVDVRTADEFKAGHLVAAVPIDWFSKSFLDEALNTLDKERPVLVYCRSGRRSAAAAAKLSKAGFKVYNLEGGYLAWTEA